MMIVAYIDGGSRGNPGPAGFGVRVESRDGELIEEFHEAIGVATNNVADTAACWRRCATRSRVERANCSFAPTRNCWSSRCSASTA